MNDLVTLFIRDNSGSYSGVCDVAEIPVYDTGSNLIGYLGSTWGEHVTTDYLFITGCLPTEIDEKLSIWGLHRVIESIE